MWIARLVLPSERRRRRDRASSGTRPRSSPVTGDGGFSLLEVLVAIGIFAVVAAFMSQELAGGLRGVLGSKRREVATQEANRILELARSLSYGAVGLVSTDATIGTCAAPADPLLSCQSSRLSYLISASSYEPLIWATNPAGHPFNPHRLSVIRASTDLVRYVYVTGVDSNGDGSIDMKRVIARVTWNNSGSTGPENEVRAQTLISPSGAIPPGTGSSTTPLTGKSFSTGGALSISSSLLGLGAPLDIKLPTSSGESKFRAVSSTSCTTNSAAINAVDLVDLPGESVTVAADDDSRTATPSNPPPQSKTAVLDIPVDVVRDLLGSGVQSPISCEADVADYGRELGSGSPLATPVTAQTNVLGLGGLLNWTLTIANVQTAPMSQQIEHELVDTEREAYSRAAAATGVVNILKLPSAGIADGLVQIDALSYSASVRAADGTPSAAPAVTSPTVTLKIYDNANTISGCTSRSGGYCNISVNPAAAGFTGVTYTVSHSFTQLVGLNVVNLSYTTAVSILPPAKSPAAGETGSNGEKRWRAEYTPVSVSASLDANAAGVSLIDADVDMSLGTVSAEACAGATCL
jgi:prepilin-type N-terminal cleavage/methylation domain-containing protein